MEEIEGAVDETSALVRGIAASVDKQGRIEMPSSEILNTDTLPVFQSRLGEGVKVSSKTLEKTHKGQLEYFVFEKAQKPQ